MISFLFQSSSKQNTKLLRLFNEMEMSHFLLKFSKTVIGTGSFSHISPANSFVLSYIFSYLSLRKWVMRIFILISKNKNDLMFQRKKKELLERFFKNEWNLLGFLIVIIIIVSYVMSPSCFVDVNIKWFHVDRLY